MQVGFLDFICLFPIILSMIFGFGSGFIKLAIGFSFFMISLFLTYNIYPIIGNFLSDYIVSETLINIISVGFAYLVSSLFCSMISRYIKKISQDVSGGFVDRIFGMVVGILRGLVISLGVFLIVILLLPGSTKESDNLYELVTIDKSKEEEYPDWVTSSFIYHNGPEMIRGMVVHFGKSNLEEVTFPDFKEED